MTYVVIKMIKGNPYKYLVRSVREGDKVRQVFVRYLGRAGEGEGKDYEPVEREVVEQPVAIAPIKETPVKETITAVEVAGTPAPAEPTSEVVEPLVEPKPTPTPVTPEVTKLPPINEVFYNQLEPDTKAVVDRLRITAEPSMPIMGQPYERTLWRGVQATGISTDEGMFGKGTYYSTDPDYAKNYSETFIGSKVKQTGKVLEQTVELKNPYVAHGGEVQQLGSNAFERAIKDGKGYKVAAEESAKTIRKTLEEQGYDGIVMPLKNAQTGLIHSEVVVFHPEKYVTLGVTKEPWEMTKTERAMHIEQKGKEAIQKWNESGSKGFPPSNPERWGVSEVNKAADELGMPWGEGRVAIPQHKYEVMVALKQGKPIPPEVLKDYPELKPTTPIEAKPAEPISEGDRVRDTQGKEWTVLDASDPSKLRVESPQGVSTSIGRKTVEKVEDVAPEVTPVTPEVTTIPINKIRTTNDEQTLEQAIINVKDGLVPKTEGQVLLTLNTDGSYTINDGFHRIAQAILNKETVISAEVRTETPEVKFVEVGEETRPYPMSPQERRRAILESRIKRGETVPDKLLAEFPDLQTEVGSVSVKPEPTPKETTKAKDSLIARHTETRISPETGLDTEYSTEYMVIEAPENAGAEWMGNPYGVIRIFTRGGVEVDRDLLEVGMSPDAVIKALPYETSYKKAEKFGLAKTEYEKYEKGLADKEQAKEAKEQAEQAGYEKYHQAIRDLGSIKGVKKTSISYFSPVDNTQKTNEGFDVGQGVGVVIHKVGNSNEYAVTHINTGLAMGHNWKNRAEAIALAKSVAGITDWSQFNNQQEIPQDIMTKAASLVRGFTQKNLQG